MLHFTHLDNTEVYLIHLKKFEGEIEINGIQKQGEQQPAVRSDCDHCASRRNSAVDSL